VLPSLLIGEKYATAMYGKMFHWEHSMKWAWTVERFSGSWSDEMYRDYAAMNASTMPDNIKPEEDFLDYRIISHAIQQLKFFEKTKQEFYMLGVGMR
jgi:hypothetical protein